jgi:hypothetical protein
MARLLLTRSTSNSRPDGDAAALINRVGALLLVAHDSLAEAEGRAMGRGAQAPAALVALREFLEDATIQQLSDVIGLTHSATVRLVDRLVADGYVLRQGSGRDGRRSSWSASLAAGWSLGRGASRSVGGCAGCAISEPADGQRVGVGATTRARCSFSCAAISRACRRHLRRCSGSSSGKVDSRPTRRSVPSLSHFVHRRRRLNPRPLPIRQLTPTNHNQEAAGRPAQRRTR